eukprot:5598679-Pleurochrysis_carterae.AAC.1
MLGHMLRCVLADTAIVVQLEQLTANRVVVGHPHAPLDHALRAQLAEAHNRLATKGPANECLAHLHRLPRRQRSQHAARAFAFQQPRLERPRVAALLRRHQ